MVIGLSPVPALDARRALGDDPRGPQRERSRPGQRADDRHHDRPGASLRRRRKGGTPSQDLGRSKGGFSTKIHLRSNALGFPVAVTLSGGQVSDMKGYSPVMNQPGAQPRVLLADKVYDADFILADPEARGVAAVIPAKRNRKVACHRRLHL